MNEFNNFQQGEDEFQETNENIGNTFDDIKTRLEKYEGIIGIGLSVASCSAATITGGAIGGVACALSEGSMRYSSCQSKND